MKPYLIFLVMVFTVNVCHAQFSGGNGTSANPYKISNSIDLFTLANNSIFWASNIYFEQTADITLSSNWSPIGNSTTKFRGSYDGKNHKISGVTINNSYLNYAGLFGYSSYATLKNLRVENVNITASNHVGGLIGFAEYSTFSSLYANNVTLSGKLYVGGLIGYASQSTVTNCYTSCTVNGKSDVGGLIGWATEYTQINKCYSNATVSGSSSDVGGFVGYGHSLNISESFSTGTVTASNNAGGFVGYLNNSTISNCYSRSNIERNSGSTFEDFGSFVGHSINSHINYCYTIGSVTYSGGTNPTDKGFVGGGSGTFTANFFDTQTTGQSTGTGATGKTTTEMTSGALTVPNFYTSANWNFKTDSNPTGIWNINSSRNNGYPFLSWQYPSDAPLPVELSSFSALFFNNQVLIYWQTATELNNYGFDIERKIGNNDYTKIAFINGAGNSNKLIDYNYIDSDLGNYINIDKIHYRLKQIDNDGNYKYIAETTVNINNYNYTLLQNYPNPFNPTTNISFTLPNTEYVTLKVYDMLGKEVTTLMDKELTAGNYTVTFDASNLSSSVYFYTLKAGKFTETKKMILTK